jgi:hypothetical protein
MNLRRDTLNTERGNAMKDLLAGILIIIMVLGSMLFSVLTAETRNRTYHADEAHAAVFFSIAIDTACNFVDENKLNEPIEQLLAPLTPLGRLLAELGLPEVPKRICH